jgi:hypothetical protein
MRAVRIDPAPGASWRPGGSPGLLAAMTNSRVAGKSNTTSVDAIEDLIETKLLAHRGAITVERPSPPNQAGKTLAKFHERAARVAVHRQRLATAGERPHIKQALPLNPESTGRLWVVGFAIPGAKLISSRSATSARSARLSFGRASVWRCNTVSW